MGLTQISFDFEAPKETPPPVEKAVKPEKAASPVVEVKPRTSSTRGRKSLKEAAAIADTVEIPPDEQLFAKMYYTMGEVAEMFKANLSLIRLWENEFDVLKPRKNRKGDRLFRPEDVKSLQLIHHLLRERKYTMQGAKEFLKKNTKAAEKFELIEDLKKLRDFLNELKAGL